MKVRHRRETERRREDIRTCSQDLFAHTNPKYKITGKLQSADMEKVKRRHVKFSQSRNTEDWLATRLEGGSLVRNKLEIEVAQLRAITENVSLRQIMNRLPFAQLRQWEINKRRTMKQSTDLQNYARDQRNPKCMAPRKLQNSEQQRTVPEDCTIMQQTDMQH